MLKLLNQELTLLYCLENHTKLTVDDKSQVGFSKAFTQPWFQDQIK